MNHKIVMKGKSIHMQTPTSIYQGENNCDNIEVLVPAFYGDIDLSASAVILNWIFHYDNIEVDENEEISDSSGNMSELTLIPSEEKNGYLSTKVPISINFTKNTGSVELWIEIMNESGVVLKTNTATFKINDHVSITEYVSNEQLDILADMLIQMQQLVNTCNSTLEKATLEADRATLAAETVIQLLEDWEAEYGDR